MREILGCRDIGQVVITHFHVDHAGAVGTGGLWHLVHRQGFRVGTTWHRDLWGFGGDGGAQLERWREHLGSAEGRALNPRVITGGGQLDLGPQLELRVVAADGAGGPAMRATSPGRRRRPARTTTRWPCGCGTGGWTISWGAISRASTWSAPAGAFSYHDVETRVAPAVGDVDVYRVNHHGSAHSSNATFLGSWIRRCRSCRSGRTTRTATRTRTPCSACCREGRCT